jgi:predicted metal-dependent peptidase
MPKQNSNKCSFGAQKTYELWETFLKDCPLLHDFLSSLERTGNKDCKPEISKLNWNLSGKPAPAAINPLEGRVIAYLDASYKSEEILFGFALASLHLALGHGTGPSADPAWQMACLIEAARLVPVTMQKGVNSQLNGLCESLKELPSQPRSELYARFKSQGVETSLIIKFKWLRWRTLEWDVHANHRMGEARAQEKCQDIANSQRLKWESALGNHLGKTLWEVSKNLRPASDDSEELRNKPWLRAKSWIEMHFPLIGSLAHHFKIVDDPLEAYRRGIEVAAVFDRSRIILLNTSAGLDEEEWRFVYAHEILHVALRHFSRMRGRDPYLWNVACDFAVNGWLVEMGIGKIPKKHPPLFDLNLKSKSSEQIYDLIFQEKKHYLKMATLAGVGVGDMLQSSFGGHQEPCDLDEFVRGHLANAMALNNYVKQGSLPAGLLEEIFVVLEEPLEWNVKLGAWLRLSVPLLEARRSFSKASRRQSSAPQWPRAGAINPQSEIDARIVGVVLDTSGSMTGAWISEVLGAFVSFCLAHQVGWVRLLECDAQVFDRGVLRPEELLGVQIVRGRGGTKLQPAIDFFETDQAFPTAAPILILSDGYTDELRCDRSHAMVVPKGGGVPLGFEGERIEV